MSETEDSGEKSKLSKDDLLKPISARKVRLRVNKFMMPTKRSDAVPHYFSGNKIRFLEAYAETLDIKMACEKADISVAAVKKCPYLAEEIKNIEQAAMFKHRVKSALGTHLRLMQKFENEFDNPIASAEMKKASMSTLARMSEANLRAAGEFGDRVENTGITGVQVVINIAAPEPEKEGPVIDV